MERFAETYIVVVVLVRVVGIVVGTGTSILFARQPCGINEYTLRLFAYVVDVVDIVVVGTRIGVLILY